MWRCQQERTARLCSSIGLIHFDSKMILGKEMLVRESPNRLAFVFEIAEVRRRSGCDARPSRCELLVFLCPRNGCLLNSANLETFCCYRASGRRSRTRSTEDLALKWNL